MNQREISNLHILIVDDDEFFTDTLCAFLESKGAQIQTCDCLQGAQQFLSHKENYQQIDFIILDSYLPDGRGIQLVETIRAIPKYLPVMMVTVDDEQTDMANCFGLGVDDYMLKPLNLDLLCLKIERLMYTLDLKEKVQHQTEVLKQMLQAKEVEEDLARYIYEHMANSMSNENAMVDSIVRASTAFNGDFLSCARGPNGCAYIMLLDATGHGLAAAISILPVSSIFRTMVQKGLNLSVIAHELNRRLESEIPDDRFVACILIQVDFIKRAINVWNGGMPDVLLLDENYQVQDAIPSGHMPLGILDEKSFNPSLITVSFDHFSHVFLCSDGLLEQESEQGKIYEMEGFLEDLKNFTSSKPLIEQVDEHFKAFAGEQLQHDDVSACHIDINRAERFCLSDDTSPLDKGALGNVRVDVSVAGKQLGKIDLVGMIDNLAEQAQLPLKLRQSVFTVVTELTSNALEHGVLGLNSELKNDLLGFADYLEKRTEKLNKLEESDWIRIQLDIEPTSPKLKFSISDSGPGYEPEKYSNNEDALSGRGLHLVRQLVDSMECSPPGNQTTIMIK